MSNASVDTGGSMRIILMLLVSMTVQSAIAAENKDTNLIAVGQGISSPTATSTINFSSGYTSESPLGTIYQNGFRVTGEYDSNDSNKAYGAEVGYGRGGEWGVAVGHRKSDCTNCDGVTAAAIGINVSDLGVGLRFGKNLSAAAVLINPHGAHRFGVMAELNTSGGSGANVTAYGLGYSYVATQMTFTIDASTNSFENRAIKDNRMQVTPGLMLRADIFQLTINDKITINKDSNNNAQNDKDHDFWFGVGLGSDKAQIALYSHYVNDFAVAGSLFF